MRPLIVLGVTLLTLSGIASAQTVRPKPLPPPKTAAPDALPPYEGRLSRLAELLGTLAFMRDLCGDGDGPAWRAKMAALLDAEGATVALRDRLAGSFNRGFEGYRLTYRTCTPAARTVITRSLAEGSDLSSEIAHRFGLD